MIGNYGKMRYSELEKKLDGISPRTLSDRLKELEGADLIKREMFDERPPRVEYSLTQTGMGLMNAIGPVAEWAASSDYVNRSRYPGPCPHAGQGVKEKSG